MRDFGFSDSGISEPINMNRKQYMKTSIKGKIDVMGGLELL